MDVHSIRKTRRLSYVHLFLLMVNLLVLILSLLCFLGLLGKIDNFFVTILSLLVSIVCIITISCNYKRLLGVSNAILLYTLATQFSLGFVYFFLGEELLNSYSRWTLRFLELETYSQAVLLAIIAVSIYSIANWIGSIVGDRTKGQIEIDNPVNDGRNIVVNTGYILLILVIIYFLILIASGHISITMSYNDYLSNRIGDTPFYSWVIVLYATGISYIVATGTKKQILIGSVLYSISAIILLATGNKGEVLYAVLACLGIAGYRKFNINTRLVVIIFLILFVIIPFVTSTRSYGVVNNLNNISINFTDAFTEMGMQIRVSTYLLNEFVVGNRDFIYGFSYINPLISMGSNFIPVLKEIEKPLYFNFSSNFPTMGFSQIAESYANFGVLGVLVFYAILGYILGLVESKRLNAEQTALFASIVVIIINATRNDFAFVPGQIATMYILYLVIKMIKNRSQAKIKV